MPRPAQTLRDTEGEPFSFADRPAGELTALFFGFTNCPDECPTAMGDLAAARRQLPAGLRDRVQVAFVTEDPDRDSPTVLRTWLDQFDPSFVGLIGGNETSKAMAQELYLPPPVIRSTDSKPESDANSDHTHDGPEEASEAGDGHTGHSHEGRDGGYSVDHPTAVYVFGPGSQTVLYSSGATSAQYAADFALLLEPS